MSDEGVSGGARLVDGLLDADQLRIAGAHESELAAQVGQAGVGLGNDRLSPPPPAPIPHTRTSML